MSEYTYIALRGAYNRVGVVLDALDQLGVAVVGDYSYRARLLVADLRVVFTAAAPNLSDLDELDIPEATRAALCRAGIGTIAQLTVLTRDDLWNVPGLAAKRIDQITSAMREAGTPLADHDEAARAVEPNGDT
jgi:hypothetical protein